MATNHILLGFKFGISIAVISWLVGIMLHSFFIKTKYYNKVSNLNFIPSKAVNNRIGIPYFKWIIKNTFFKFFNQKIQIQNKKTDLTHIRNEMTQAEIGHLIAFVFAAIFAIYKSFTVSILFGISMSIANILLNLYPALLQQENKRRIDKLIAAR